MNDQLKYFALVLVCLIYMFKPNVVIGQDRWRAGVELDVLPYITGGYFGGAWVGKNHVRIRALYAKVNLPQFIIPDGFTNNTIRSLALVGDYFLRKDQTGWWIGAGVVSWQGDIQSDAKLETVDYQSYLLNGSIGYLFPLFKGLYVSPWAGLSLRVAGDENIQVDGLHYKPPFFNPELSLKIGYGF